MQQRALHSSEGDISEKKFTSLLAYGVYYDLHASHFIPSLVAWSTVYDTSYLYSFCVWPQTGSLGCQWCWYSLGLGWVDVHTGIWETADEHYFIPAVLIQYLSNWWNMGKTSTDAPSKGCSQLKPNNDALACFISLCPPFHKSNLCWWRDFDSFSPSSTEFPPCDYHSFLLHHCFCLTYRLRKVVPNGLSLRKGLMGSTVKALPWIIPSISPCIIAVKLSVVGSGPILLPGYSCSRRYLPHIKNTLLKLDNNNRI